MVPHLAANCATAAQGRADIGKETRKLKARLVALERRRAELVKELDE